ncbi:MAG: hypothetical protein JW915_13890 [Chitinispirillaceae bacterium]|nr:hypothetical protein [Chitinispirillaceae bacterium]
MTSQMSIIKHAACNKEMRPLQGLYINGTIRIVLPVLIIIVNAFAAEFAGGNGSQEKPYQIATVEQLNNVRNHLNAHFILTANLDFMSTPYRKLDGWVPIGNNDRKFYGGFNGNNYKIANLFIKRESENCIGLFGDCNAAYIIKLHLENCDITGNEDVGAIAGKLWNGSMIDMCSAEGWVSGSNNTGGIAGSGIFMGPSISNCFSNVIVSGYSHSGGIVGVAKNCTIKHCYARGQVSGIESGGLVGIDDGYNSIEDCFYNKEISGQSDTGKGTGLTTIAMREQSTYKNWDFETTWQMDPKKNDGYPFLKSKKRIIYGSFSTVTKKVNTDRLLNNDDIAAIRASSTLEGKDVYKPYNIHDTDSTTAWVEGVAGDGVGEWIEIEFSRSFDIKAFEIANGYGKSKKIYEANNRVKDLGIVFYTTGGPLESRITLGDESFKKSDHVVTETFSGCNGVLRIRFTILSVYKGKKYDDTCISEICFLGK